MINCAPIQRILEPAKPAIVQEACAAKTVTPWVYIGGHQLVFAEQSDHKNVATFYGRNAIVRVHTVRNQVVKVTAVSVTPWPQRLKVRLSVRHHRISEAWPSWLPLIPDLPVDQLLL